MALSNTDLITELYIGYFNRAPDPAGLQYWLDGMSKGVTFSQIADQFAKSSESTAIYPYLTLPDVVSPDSFINQVYQNVLGRPAEPAGLAYWKAALQNGVVTTGGFISTIIETVNKQTGTADALTLQHKLTVAEYYTTQIATNNIPFTQASAKAALANVDSTDASVAVGKANVDATVQGGTPGQTYALTTGVDNFVGTNASDTFTANLAVDPTSGKATLATLTSFDSVDGGAGNDTLNVYYTGAVTSVAGTVKNVENINFYTDDALTADVSAWTGATSVMVTETGANKVALTTAASAVIIKGGKGNTVADGSDATASKAVALKTVTIDGNVTTKAVVTGAGLTNVNVLNTAAGVDITNGAAALTKTAALNLTVNNVTSAAAITDTANEYKTINVTATGKASSVTLAGTAATTLAVSGDAALTAAVGGLTNLSAVTIAGAGGLTADLSAGTIKSIDASASSGANVVTVDGTVATYKGGSGADTVNLAAAPTKLIDGGAGIDTASFAAVADLSTLTKTSLSNLANFELLQLTGAAGTAGDAAKSTLDVSGLPTGFTGVVLNSATLANDIKLSNAASGFNLTELASANKNVTVALKTDGSADVLNLTIGNTKSAAVDLATSTKLVATTFETVNIVANADTSVAAVTHSLKLDDATATALNISGNAGVDFTGSTLTSVATVSASSATGNIKVDLTGGVTTGVTVTTGSGADTITTVGAAGKIDNIDSGSGNDTIVVGAGNNVIHAAGGDTTVGVSITAGNGNNTITVDAGKAAITVGNGDNVISAGSGVDVVTVGSGSNAVTLGAGNDTLKLGAVNASSAVFTTVKDLAAGDQIDTGINFANTTGKLGAALTSGVNDYQTFLDAAAAKGAGVVSWFQFGGDTYLVEDNVAGSTTFVNGQDVIVKIAGLVDLSNSTLTNGAHVLTIA